MHWGLGVVALIKILHVVVAAAWLGAAMYGVFALRPVLMQSPPAVRGPFMTKMGPASMKYFQTLAGLTILSGLLLIYAMRDGFSGLGDAWGRLVMAAFLAAIAVILISVVAVKRSATRLAEIMKDSRPDEPPSMLALILQKRMAMAQVTVVVILLLATAAMVAANMGVQV